MPALRAESRCWTGWCGRGCVDGYDRGGGETGQCRDRRIRFQKWNLCMFPEKWLFLWAQRDMLPCAPRGSE